MTAIDLINQIRWDVRKRIAMPWRYGEFHIQMWSWLLGRLTGRVMFSIQQAIDQEARHNVWTPMHRGR